jgi:hypothetical protein
MPITFKSKQSPDILMLETAALELIKLMGHSGAVPGSLAADDVSAALQRLEQAVHKAPNRALEADNRRVQNDEEESVQVSVAQRALPLLEMLKAALQAQDYVIWDR